MGCVGFGGGGWCGVWRFSEVGGRLRWGVEVLELEGRLGWGVVVLEVEVGWGVG